MIKFTESILFATYLIIFHEQKFLYTKKIRKNIPLPLSFLFYQSSAADFFKIIAFTPFIDIDM